MTSLISRIFRICSFALGALALFSYLFLPMNSVWSRLHIPPSFMEKYLYAPPVFATLIALLFFLYSKFFHLWDQQSGGALNESPKLPNPKWKAPGLILLASFVLIRAIVGIEQPFDNDEMAVAYTIAKGTPLGPLFYDATHPLSSYMAIGFAQLFGQSFWSVRLPALLFCAGFLFVLVRFCLVYAGTVTSIFLIGHLASSSIFVWYFHSTRGFAPMILFNFIIFSIAYGVCVHREAMTRTKWVAIVLASLIMPITHGFGLLFALLFPIALTLWTVANNENLRGTHRKTVFHLNAVLLTIAPVLALFLGYMFYLTASLNGKYVGMDPASKVAQETFYRAIAMVLGSSHDVTLKLIFLLLGANLIFLVRSRQLFKDFTLTVLFAFIGFVVLQKALLSTYVTGRYFLGVLPIFTFWFLHTIEKYWPLKNQRYAIPVLLLVFVGFPIYDGAPGLFQLPHDDYYQFLRTARSVLKGVNPSCIDFSHSDLDPAANEAFAAKHYYFKSREASLASLCPKRFQLHFSASWSPEDPSVPRQMGTFEELPPGKTYQLLQTDGVGRFLTAIDSVKP